MDFQKKPLGPDSREPVTQPTEVQPQPAIVHPIDVKSVNYPRKRMLVWRIFIILLLIVATALLVTAYLYLQELSSQVNKKDTEIAQLQDAGAKSSIKTSKVSDADKVTNTATDKDQITDEVTRYSHASVLKKNAVVVLKGYKTNGEFARVTVEETVAGKAAGSYAAILKKVDNEWTIVFADNEPPTEELLGQYGVPADYVNQ